ncbi:MAG: hypothetical protein APR63_05375 [Desulfuromonas sp. SDB]|nr:MAG: hypothetical protein APR63_05375 [Desulfuromonas sp. SDB]
MNHIYKILNTKYWELHRRENFIYLAMGFVLSVFVSSMIVLAPPESKTEFFCMILGLVLMYLGEIYFILVFIFSKIRK